MCAQSVARGQVDSLVAVREEIQELNLHSSWPLQPPGRLPCPRSLSAVSEFLPLAPFRSRSRPSTSPAASAHTPSMPRTGAMSVARLYDWSQQGAAAAEREAFVSVSRLYREMAKGPKASLARSQSERTRPWPAGAQWLGPPGSKTRANPGRMFLRDKGVLTKGEKEIIAGIYKNRGDLRRDQSGVKSEYIVRSHHDAWLVGKHCMVHKPSSEIPRPPPPFGDEPPQDTVTPAARPSLDTPDLRTSEEHSPVTCAMCLKEQRQQQQQLQQQQKLEQHHKQQQQKQQQQQQKQQQQKHQQKQQPPSTLKHKRTPVTSPREKSVVHPGRLFAVDSVKRSKEPSAPPSSPDGSSSTSFLTPSVSPARPVPQEKLAVPPSRAPQEPCLPGAQAPQTAEKPGAGSPLPQQPHAEQEPCSQGPTSQRRTSQACEDFPKGGLEVPEACGQSQSSQDSDDSKPRLRVKVYLPQIAPEPTEDELKSRLMQGRPALARERPLSQADLKFGQKQQLSPSHSDKTLSSDIAGFEKRQESWRVQHQQNSRKTSTLTGEVFTEKSGAKPVSANNPISSLSAEIEDWQLVDE